MRDNKGRSTKQKTYSVESKHRVSTVINQIQRNKVAKKGTSEKMLYHKNIK